MTPVKVTAAVCVNKGKIRSNNEDNFYINGQHLDDNNRDNATTIFDENSKPVAMYAVFDGMGGEEMGEEASLYAAQSLKASHDAMLQSEQYNVTGTVMNSIGAANDMICAKITENNGRRMGTTYALVAVQDNTAVVYNVGDSRVYMMRGGKLWQVSVDDTATQSLINMNLITKEEAKTHRDRNKLTQHLGIFNTELIISPHVSNEIALEKGDRFLICSDGLTDMVSDERIEEILSENKTVSEIANELVDEALLNGGRDNVTCLVVEAGNGTGTGSMSAFRKTAVILFALMLVVFAVVVAIVHFNSDNNSGKTTGDTKVSSDVKKPLNSPEPVSDLITETGRDSDDDTDKIIEDSAKDTEMEESNYTSDYEIKSDGDNNPEKGNTNKTDTGTNEGSAKKQNEIIENTQNDGNISNPQPDVID